MISLGREGAYLTLSGEARSTYEFYDHHTWGDGPQDGNGYLLLRFRGGADLHLGRRFRVFVELQSGLIEGRTGGPRPSQDRDALDASQLFAGWRWWRGAEAPALEVRVGRQELNYGEGTLLATRDLNVRRPFDGIKATLRSASWRVDLLAFRPARLRTGALDDGSDASQALWGAWATRSWVGRPFWRRADLYYLGLERQQGRFQQGTAAEKRHTVGVNLHGERGALSTLAEADIQFGSFGAGEIRAGKLAGRLAWSLPARRLRPVLKLQGAVSSGDRDPASADLETFHPLFPRGLYYGRVDSSGSLNAIVVHPELDLTLSPTVSLELSHFSFWRQSTNDGLYSQPGGLLRRGDTSRDRDVGSLEEVTVRWLANRHTTLEGTAAYYEVGAFLERAPQPGRDFFYLALRVSYRF